MLETSSDMPSSGGAMMEAHAGAQVAVLSPRPGEVVSGGSRPGEVVSVGSVRFRVAISNFHVDCGSAGTPDLTGVGHYHVTVDGSLVNMYREPSGAVSMLDVKPHSHTLAFIPASNEHADDMPAVKMVPITYQPAHAASVAPLHFAGKRSKSSRPKPGETVHGVLTLHIAVRNFQLSCAMYGKPDVAGYGHRHLNVDSTTAGMMGMGTMMRMNSARTLTLSLAHIKPGPHTFFAILEDNQHAPTPHAQASIRVNVG